MSIVSVPSYLIPGTYLENIEFIAGIDQVENIELLFFQFDAETELLLREELPGIAEHRQRFSYSVHMPDILDESHEKLIDLARPIADRFVIHTPPADDTEFLPRLERWISNFGNVFLMENVVGRDIDACASAFPELPICFDTGHLLLENTNPALFAKRWAGRIGEIHLHGINDGKDHSTFSECERWFVELTPFLASFHGVIHIEIFDYKKCLPMIELISDLNTKNKGKDVRND